MKKLTLMLALLLTAMTGYGASLSWDITFNPGDLSLKSESLENHEYVLPYMQGLEYPTVAGMPSLPTKHLSFVLPLESSDIELVTIGFDNPLTVSLGGDIMPVQEDCIINDLPNWKPTLEIDKQYSVIETPTFAIDHVEAYMDLFKIVFVSVCPFSYNQADGKLTLYRNLKFTVNSGEKINPQQKESQIKVYSKVCKGWLDHELNAVKEMVENPNEIGRLLSMLPTPNTEVGWQLPDEREAYQYTIITSSSLASSFQRLVALKRIQGLEAGIVCIEDILSDSRYAQGDTQSNLNDDAGKLKAYLMDHSDLIDYVFLAGKPPIIPIRYGFHNFRNDLLVLDRFIPSDLYFGTGTTANWGINPDTTGIQHLNFGYSSLFKIGRLLCTTKENINNYLDKLDIYELNPGFGNYDYLKRAYTNVSLDISRNMNCIKLCDSVSACYNNHTYYHHMNNNPNKNDYGAEVIETINSNNFGFLNLHGHGSPEGISTFEINENSAYGVNALDAECHGFVQENLNGLDNIDNFGYPNFVFAGSCGTAAFDSPRYQNYGKYNTCFDHLSLNAGESFTMGKNYGGPLYLGFTRAAYVKSTKVYAEYLCNRIKNGLNIPISTIRNNTILYRFGYNPGYHNDRLGYSIIGDPSIVIWNPSQNLSSVSTPTISRTDSTIVVSLRTGLTNPNVTVSLFDPIGHYGKLGIGNGGVYTFENASPYSIVYVSSPGKIPYIGNLNIAEHTIIRNSNYVYANNVVLGDSTSTSVIPVLFTNGVRYVIDAKGDVHLNNNVFIQNNSQLDIFCEGTCYLEGIHVLLNARLRIQANNYVISTSIEDELADGRIILKNYDKYGQGNNAPLQIRKKSTDDYRPLLQQGKEWRYTQARNCYVKWGVPEDITCDVFEYNQILRLEGVEEIDGVEYQVLKAYNNPENLQYYTSGSVFAYLREDTESHKVWMRLNAQLPYMDDTYMGIACNIGDITGYYPQYEDTYSHEVLLYDFDNAENSAIVEGREYMGETTVDGIEGKYPLYSIVNGEYTFALVDGIGTIPMNELYLGRDAVNLLGIVYDGIFNMTVSSAFFPHLYEVVDGDGNVLYQNDACQPGWTAKWTDGIKDAEARMTVRVDGDCIEIPAVGANTEVTLANAQGIVLGTYTLGAETLRIPVKHLPSGVYILSTPPQTLKFTK